MKHVLALAALAALIGLPIMAQNINDELRDQVNEQVITTDLVFEEAASCDALTQRITNRIDKHKDTWTDGRGYPLMYRAEVQMVDSAANSVTEDVDASSLSNTHNSSTNDYSTTNIQKAGIDEPDIYKTDGDILYYYNNTNHMVYLIQSPLDRSDQTITLSDMDIHAQITIPDTLQSSNLYIYDDELIIVGQRWKHNNRRRGWLDGGSTTFVARYNVSDSMNPSLMEYTEHDGYLTDSRLSLTDGTLIVMTTVSPSWHQLRSDDTIDTENITLPKTINITPDTDGRTSDITPISCEQTFLLLPSDETLTEIGDWPSFTTIHTHDLDDDNSSAYAAFGSAGQIHVSHNHIYLAQHMRLPSGRYTCPADARCVMPMFWGGNANTLIHGFTRNGTNISYQGSNLVAGAPMNDQYSMDEHDGLLRILTSVWQPEQNTHLWILDEELNIEGKLTDIQKDERFQGSRFIGDKLYLITFEQVDPLFVIDMADPSTPAVIGELKMPGRSNYLHPIASDNDDMQYLIGVGYDAGENERGGTSREGVKVDLYAIDYTQKETSDSLCGSLDRDSQAYEECLTHVDTDRIRVDRLDSLVFGEGRSYTPVAQNQRLFVYREDTGHITLPLLEKAISKEIKRCTVTYENDVPTDTDNCRRETQYTDTFAGYKIISVDLDEADGTMSVTGERNFLDRITSALDERHDTHHYTTQGLGQWLFDQIGPRVAFVGDTQVFLTNYFIDATLDDQSHILPFVKSNAQ